MWGFCCCSFLVLINILGRVRPVRRSDKPASGDLSFCLHLMVLEGYNWPSLGIHSYLCWFGLWGPCPAVLRASSWLGPGPYGGLGVEPHWPCERQTHYPLCCHSAPFWWGLGAWILMWLSLNNLQRFVHTEVSVLRSWKCLESVSSLQNVRFSRHSFVLLIVQILESGISLLFWLAFPCDTKSWS